MAIPPASPPPELLDRARSGDLSALSSLIERLRFELVQAVRSIAGRCLSSRIEPEDVFQESVVEAMTSITDLRAGDLRGFRAWFLGIARNRIFFFTKRERPRVRPRSATALPASQIHFQDPTGFEETCGHAAPGDSAVHESSPPRVKTVRVPGDQRVALILRELFEARWGTVAFVLRRPSSEAARQVHLRARRRFTQRVASGAWT
jgi:DNA-directed RNA polymerase specialized sigma24 family protein